MSASPRCALALAVALAASSSAPAITLIEAYDAALTADFKYQADRHERDAAQHAVPIARAALRPTLSLTAAHLRYNGSREVPGPAASTTQDLHYTAPQQGLQLRQPLYHPEGWRGVTHAQEQAALGERVLAIRGVDLVDRLATTYLRALQADEELRLTQAQVQALEAQALSARRRLDRGEGTRIEILETAARLDIARARRVDAQDALAVARTELRNIVGREPGALQALPADFAPPPLQPTGVDLWIDRALLASAALAARRQAVAVAEAEVSRTRAGHLPRLDLVAGINRSRSESVSTLDQKLNQRFIGVQLNLPLYAGGLVDARTDQALAQMRRAEAELALERATMETQVRRFYLAVHGAQERLAAHASAVAASEAALESMRRSLTAGLRTNVEVLDAQQQVFVARRDQAEARHAYLLAHLRLHANTGTPAEQALAMLSALLADPNISTDAPAHRADRR